MLSQVISNFLKITTGITQEGVPISSPWMYQDGSNSVKIKTIKDWNETTKNLISLWFPFQMKWVC